jgi:hypothetical protein
MARRYHDYFTNTIRVTEVVDGVKTSIVAPRGATIAPPARPSEAEARVAKKMERMVSKKKHEAHVSRIETLLAEARSQLIKEAELGKLRKKKQEKLKWLWIGRVVEVVQTKLKKVWKIFLLGLKPN